MGVSRRTFVASVAATPSFSRHGGFAIAQTSTPATPSASAAFGNASDRFREMMAIGPTTPLEGYVNFTWVDLERHTAAFPTLDPVEVETSLPAGMIVDSPAQYLYIEHITGYAFMQIRQQVTLGAGRSLVRIARLDADARALPETWENNGFERQDSDAGSFWTIGEGDEDSGENELHHRFQGAYNSVTVLEDDLIAIAPNPDLLHDVMVAHHNQEYALADVVEPLASTLYEDTTSVWHTEGRRLILTERTYWDVNAPDALDESDAAVGPMPVIDTVTVCLTAGASSDYRLLQAQTRESIMLRSAEPNQAEQMAKVVHWRLENLSGLYNSGPYADAYSDLEIEILDHDLVRVTATGLVARYFQFTVMVIERTALLFTYRYSE